MRKALLAFFAFFLLNFTNAQLLTQSFDAVGFPPTGWTNTAVVGGATDVWARVTTTTNLLTPQALPHSGAGMAQYDAYNYAPGNSADLATPALNMSSGGPYRVRFWMYRDDRYSFNDDSMSVFINTAGPSATGGTWLGGIGRHIGDDPVAPGRGWYEYTFDIPASFNGATNYVIFRANSEYGTEMVIDDVVVEAQPSCVPPTGLTNSGITLTTANHSWTAATGAPLGYEWAVTTSATPPASGTATALLTASSSGLTAGTLYYLHVRSSCAGATFSSWATASFSTLIANDNCGGAITLAIGSGSCSPITGTTAGATASGTTPVPTCGVGSLGYDDDVWFSFTPGAGQTTMNLDFATISGDGDMVAQIYTSSDNTCGGTFTTFACSDDDGPGSMPQFVALTVVPGTTYFVRVFTYSTAVSGVFSICAYTPPAPPPCTTNLLPANGATGVLIPGGQANISWNASAGATSYNVFFGTVNPPTTNLGNIAATNVNITGLAYNTTYYWYIQPVGPGGNSTGCNTSTTSFTTENPTNCIPLYTTGCSSADSISYFSLKGNSGTVIYNPSGATCSSTPRAYSDYTAAFTPVTLTRSESYSGFIKTGDANDYISMWIDGNDNGYFEDNERILSNLKAATTKKLYSVYIPSTMPLGVHRLRVRAIYSGSAPGAATHPCNPYTWGETEDYLVDITGTGSTRAVAPGTPGSCTNASETVVNALSNNTNATPVYLLDSLNNYVAGLYPQGNNLGGVRPNFYVHNGPVRQDVTGRYYLDRNISIGVDTQPASTYNLRYFFSNAELNALIAQPGSGVTSVFDLVMTKTLGVECVTQYVQQTPTLVNPAGFGSVGSDRFIDFTSLSSFSRFFAHGGSTVLLPVKLSNFSGQVTGSSNTVYWTTTQEKDNHKFIVERSTNGSSFTVVGEVASRAVNGNSSSNLDYQFADANPPQGKAYYRLQMVAMNGRQTASPIVTIRRGGGKLEIVDVRPNPTSNLVYFNVLGGSNSSLNVVVRNLQGGEVMRTSLVQRANYSLNLEKLSSGLYLIEATDSRSGEKSVFKVVKD